MKYPESNNFSLYPLLPPWNQTTVTSKLEYCNDLDNFLSCLASHSPVVWFNGSSGYSEGWTLPPRQGLIHNWGQGVLLASTEARDPANHSTMHRTGPYNKELSGQKGQ